MALIKTIKTHVLKHIWEAYALKLIADGSNTRFGIRYNDIKNYYVYELVSESYTGEYVVRSYKRKRRKVQVIMTYEQFRKVVERYLEKAKYAIIQGEALDLLGGLGKICARRVERDFTKKNHLQINWQKTKEYAAKHGMDWNEEKQKFVYKKKIFFTDADWCRIGWDKRSRIPNEMYYEFKPTASSSREQTVGALGFQDQFHMALSADKTLRYRYVFHPIFIPKPLIT